MPDELSQRYGDLLDGSYDCVDRIVLNGYFRLCYSGGGFREWWRRLMGSEEKLDNAHLMRMAGRFSRRVRGSAKAHGIPVIDCRRGERKHEIAEEYLATHTVKRGLFPLNEPMAVARHAVNRTGVKPGGAVVVFGAGPIGLGATIGYKLSGARSVVVADVIPSRLEKALAVGADAVAGVVPRSVSGTEPPICSRY